MELEGRRRALCAAMRHSSQCRFSNCDKIDGACGKTKRIIKASADTFMRESRNLGKTLFGSSPYKDFAFGGQIL